jgi:hypothetical protein
MLAIEGYCMVEESSARADTTRCWLNLNLNPTSGYTSRLSGSEI